MTRIPGANALLVAAPHPVEPASVHEIRTELAGHLQQVFPLQPADAHQLAGFVVAYARRSTDHVLTEVVDLIGSIRTGEKDPVRDAIGEEWLHAAQTATRDYQHQFNILNGKYAS